MDNSEEKLVLVDALDTIVGYESKDACHRGGGLLHRAFSVFIFNDKKELLLQKRSRYKQLWPLFWSNSVCSHPREQESYEEAGKRRLRQELGIQQGALKFLFKFQYQARYGEIGSENEVCAVFAGRNSAIPALDPQEVAEFRYVDIETFNRQIIAHPETFTPWLRMEWKKIQENHLSDIASL